jgi:hypothetical protein
VVTGFVDRAHASLAQFFEDIEMRDPSAEWNRRHVFSSIQQAGKGSTAALCGAGNLAAASVGFCCKARRIGAQWEPSRDAIQKGRANPSNNHHGDDRLSNVSVRRVTASRLSHLTRNPVLLHFGDQGRPWQAETSRGAE